MSLVSIVATKQYVSVMSDGRVTLNGQPTNEEYVKFIKYNDSFVAFAGMYLQIIERVANKIIDEVKNGLDFKTIAKITQKTIFDLQSDGPLLFAIGGKNNQGEIEFFLCGNNIEQELPFSPQNDDDIAIGILYNSQSNINVEKRLEYYLALSGYKTSREALSAQKMLNEEVSSVDLTVNQKTFHLVI